MNKEQLEKLLEDAILTGREEMAERLIDVINQLDEQN